MSQLPDELLQTALQLPAADRLLLATELLGSLDASMPGISTDQNDFFDELDRRAQDPSPGVPWEEVKQSIDNKFRQ